MSRLGRLVGSLISIPALAWAAGAPDASFEQSFALVKQWRGTLEVVEDGNYSNDCHGYATSNSGSFEGRMTSSFVLDAKPNGPKNAAGIFRWRGDGTATLFREKQYRRDRPDGTGSAQRDVASGSVPYKDAQFELDVRRGIATFGNGTLAEPGVAYTGTWRKVERGGGPRITLVEDQGESSGYVSGMAGHFDVEMAAGHGPPRVLEFSVERDASFISDFQITDAWSCLQYAEQRRLGTHRARLWLTPVFDEIELLVHIDGTQLSGTKVPYAEWLPEGIGADGEDAKPGSRLAVKARLQQADGRPSTLDVKEMRFELHDTSREPSVAMNSPRPERRGDQTARDPDWHPDLRFDKKYGPLESTDDVQRQTVQPHDGEDGAPTADTVIEAYDYGAWSDLVVVAKLAGGREITGKLDTDRTLFPIPLPKRSNGSKIADGWRERQHADGADSDDSEKTAIGEPGCNGDGLTLYEEYRGFMIGGRHERLDPTKKDLLIYNKCGALASPGIAMFERLSGIHARANLQQDERNFDVPEATRFGIPINRYTAINAYSHRGAHRVDQHRIEILTCDGTRGGGGATAMNRATDNKPRHGRPFFVLGITMDGPDGYFWRRQYGVRAIDEPRQFDVAMTHELLHAVGVDHHGDGDYMTRAVGFEASAPGNPGGHAGWYEAYFGTVSEVHFFDEASGADISQRWLDAARYTSAQRTQAIAAEPALKGFANASSPVQVLFVGHPQGEHSGDASCVMRYWLADAYEKQGEKDAYYIVPDGTEPVGTRLCKSTDGTAINAHGRLPQPRYFDAHPSRGRCSDWICVNDAIAPRSSEIASAP